MFTTALEKTVDIKLLKPIFRELENQTTQKNVRVVVFFDDQTEKNSKSKKIWEEYDQAKEDYKKGNVKKFILA